MIMAYHTESRCYVMKRQYKVLIGMFFAGVFISSFLYEMGLRVDSWIGNFLGIFVCLLPIQILLIIKGKDQSVSKKKRMFFLILFWYINICYVLISAVALLW